MEYKEGRYYLANKANVDALEEEVARLFLEGNRTYPGRDLSVAYADEIAAAAGDTPDQKAFSWIQGRINAGDYSGLSNEDWIPLTVPTGEGGTSETHLMQLAGMDSYTGTGWSETHGSFDTADLNPVPHHIDFVSKECMAPAFQWNTTATNSGTGTADDGTDVPWLESSLYKALNTNEDSVLSKLPQWLRNMITNKIALLERRAKADSPLTASTGWHWYPMGKLWVPNEYELFGSVVWGTPGWSSGQQIQYPLFAHSWASRLKGKGPVGDRCHWWLSVPSGASASAVCAVGAHGNGYWYSATSQLCVPLCFRIAARGES